MYKKTDIYANDCKGVIEKPGLPEIAKPKFGGDTYVPVEEQFWKKYSEDILKISVLVVGLGVLAICDHFYDFSSISAKKDL